MTKDRRKVTAICNHCGIVFEKAETEVKRNAKLNRKNYCGRSCVAYAANNLGKTVVVYDISIHARNRYDEYSVFREIFRRARQRKHECTINLAYLKNLWNIQSQCPYSGVQLVLSAPGKRIDLIYSASLDRIDSTKGYIPGNVQFVSTAVNYMKNTMSHEETLKLCKLIAQYHKI